LLCGAGRWDACSPASPPGLSRIRRDTPLLTLPRFLMVEECTPAVLRRLLSKSDAAREEAARR
ncbi:hypothetical protein DIJ60_28315, partial [Burkholderia pseudomallei]